MGMFDYIRSDMPLPELTNAERDKIEFQTKSLDCSMETYRISENGRLLKQEYTVEDRSDPTKDGIAGLIGIMTHIPTGFWNDTYYHGWLTFYGMKRDEDLTSDNETNEWFEYTAKFTDGTLITVVRVNKNG